MELIQSSFAEERRRREAASSQLLYKTEELRHLSKRLEEEQEVALGLRAEIHSLGQRLVSTSSQARESVEMARKECEVVHSIKIETLSLEIDRLKARHEEAQRAAEALHRQRLTTEVESHRAKIRVSHSKQRE